LTTTLYHKIMKDEIWHIILLKIFLKFFLTRNIRLFIVLQVKGWSFS
jgi:hypothetical protein